MTAMLSRPADTDAPADDEIPNEPRSPWDVFYAYAGKRALDRHTTTGARLHAVSFQGELTGMDSECGVQGYVKVGEWDPTDAAGLNCPDCTAWLAGAHDLDDDDYLDDDRPVEPMRLVPLPAGPCEQLQLVTCAPEPADRCTGIAPSRRRGRGNLPVDQLTLFAA